LELVGSTLPNILKEKHVGDGLTDKNIFLEGIEAKKPKINQSEQRHPTRTEDVDKLKLLVFTRPHLSCLRIQMLAQNA
jgi:hypothetical protein